MFFVQPYTPLSYSQDVPSDKEAKSVKVYFMVDSYGKKGA